MTASGREIFDKTIQTTNAWLNEIMEAIGPDRRRAYHILTAVRHALCDRLTVDEAKQLGAQQPFWCAGSRSGKPERLRRKEDFLAAA
jgi:uncharacterized protein (DUF2267 family)